jgi:hypothetical protein
MSFGFNDISKKNINNNNDKRLIFNETQNNNEISITGNAGNAG